MKTAPRKVVTAVRMVTTRLVGSQDRLSPTVWTKMAERGMGAKILQYLMGHKDIATTLSYYVGITPSMKEEAALMMPEII
nr:hypothetical protein [Kallipyga massiliensis]